MSERFRVLVTDGINAEGLKPLTSDARFELVTHAALNAEQLQKELAGIDALLVRSATRVPREALVGADRLKVIGRAGVGVDTIDVEAATERGVAVLNAPAGNTISAAELTMALLLALVRRVAGADRSMKNGEWDRKSFSGIELYGKTLGLIGAGRIGAEVARRSRAFGMRVLAYDPFLAPDRARTLEIELASLDDVLRNSDVISLHAPLTESTAGIVGAPQLAMLRKGAFVLNVARGGLIDEKALLAELESKRLGGAALDVFETEPLPKDHPFRRLDNVVLTPHLGASTAEAQQNVAVEISEAVRAALIDGDFTRAVNAPAIGGEEMRRMRPLLDLGQRLGILAAALCHGAIEEVEIRYAGSSENMLQPLASTALIGVLKEAVGKNEINLVNAMHLAEMRGIQVQRVRLPARGDYAEYVELRIRSEKEATQVAGALLAQRHPRVVRIGDYHVDIFPRHTLLVLRNRDVPGVIGRVGTALGDAGINIGEYHQARREAGGEALAAISVDGRLAADAMESLRQLPEILEVRQVQLD